MCIGLIFGKTGRSKFYYILLMIIFKIIIFITYIYLEFNLDCQCLFGGEYSIQEHTSRRSDSVYSTNTIVIVIFGFSPFLARV